MLIQRPAPAGVRGGEITSERLWLSRRTLLRGAAAGAVTLGTALLSDRLIRPGAEDGPSGRPLHPRHHGAPTLSASEPPTPYGQVTGYNNFYEFGTDKYSPARLARGLCPPGALWTVRVEGLVSRPRTVGLEDLLRPDRLEERTYHLRCVEGWSMVIPWVGLPLATLLGEAEVLSAARYVEFHALHDPVRMPGQRRGVLDWPYVEGLRLDEALHPLTLLAVGLYGRVLPGQNGTPVRLVVPWKYGFKSIKSLTTIRLVAEQPATTWVRANPDEYGFYANVNPAVDHPRWSQARERRLGEIGRRPTQPFNGYGAEVASLYAGMDLRRFF